MRTAATVCAITLFVAVILASNAGPGRGDNANGSKCFNTPSLNFTFPPLPPAYPFPTAAFGMAVTMSDTEDILVLGSPGARADFTVGTTASGAVFPYRLNATTGQWDVMQPPLVTGGRADHFGVLGLLLRGDTLFIPAFGTPIGDAGTDVTDQDMRGSVHIFRLDRNSWTFSRVQVLDSNTEPGLADLSPTIGDGDTGAKLGFHLAIDTARQWLFASAHGNDNVLPNGTVIKEAGSAYIFKYYANEDKWHFHQRLDRPDGPRGWTYWGYEVAVDNGWAVVGDGAIVSGTPPEPPKPDNGAAYIYRYNPATDLWEFTQKLVGDQTDALTAQIGVTDGYACEMAMEGSFLAVAACFESTSMWLGGAVYFYHLDTRGGHDMWVRTNKFMSDRPHPGNSLAGFGLDMRGPLVVVGDMGRYSDSGEPLVGGMQTFVRIRAQNSPRATWVRGPVITHPEGKHYDQFGAGVAIGGADGQFVAGGCFPMFDLIFGAAGRGPPVMRDPFNPETALIPGYGAVFKSPCDCPPKGRRN